MPLLHVALQEGFTGDPVVVRVNGREVLRHEGLRTRLQIGFAASVEVEVPEGEATVELALPARSLAATVPTRGNAPVYLGLSVADEALEQRISAEPFGYL